MRKSFLILTVISMIVLFSCSSKDNSDTNGNSDTDIFNESDSLTDDDSSLSSCGNGKVESGEACDKNSKKCTDISDVFTGGDAECKSDCSGFSVAKCERAGGNDEDIVIPEKCGNEVLDSGEVCDSDTKDCKLIDSSFKSGKQALCRIDCSGYDTTVCERDVALPDSDEVKDDDTTETDGDIVEPDTASDDDGELENPFDDYDAPNSFDGKTYISRFGDTNLPDFGNSIVSGGDGILYIGGMTRGKLDPNGSSDGKGGDAVVAKFEYKENNLTKIWVKQFGGFPMDLVKGIAVDKNGRVVVSGTTSGAIFPGADDLPYDDVFAVVLSPENGEVQCYLQFGTDNEDYAQDIKTDVSGNIYVVGRTVGAFDFQTNYGDHDMFVAKLDSNCTFQWVKQFGTKEFDEYNAVVTDSAGNVYVTGHGLVGPTSTISHDFYVRKLKSSDGSTIWQKVYASEILWDEAGYAAAMAKDDSALYIAGTWEDENSVFKINPSDGSIIWTAHWYSVKNGEPINSFAKGITLHEKGIFVTGTINPYGLLSENPEERITDVLMAKVNYDGTVAWADLKAGINDSWGTSITSDSSNIYLFGTAKHNIEGDGKTANPNENEDMFFMIFNAE